MAIAVRIALLFAVVFIMATGHSMPAVVASHFGVGGAPNGNMSRGAYLALMLGVTVAVPAFISLMSAAIAHVPARYVNLPNRAYWLSDERRDETIQYLSNIGRYFALAIAALLCFVHWLVVQANALRPPHLDEGRMVTALVVFLVVMGVGTVAFLAKFLRQPR